jgi:hypothetical protein
MPTRRSALALLTAFAASGFRREPAAALLDRAIARAGGRRALDRAKVLAWTGEAMIFAGGRRIEIGASTVVEPFAYARSESWLKADGPARSRTMLIEGDQGRILRGGKTEPMPAAMLAHERQQFAAYGLMRLVTLRDKGAAFRLAGPDATGLQGLEVAHPSAPPAVLWFGPDGRLAALTDRVPDPEGGPAPIEQRFTFEGEIVGAGVRWPRTLRIAQNGAPYFELTLSSFSPRPSR